MIQVDNNRQLWHTPAPDNPTDAQAALTQFRLGALKNLTIVDYSFNMESVDTEIEEILERGVEVTCVLDSSQSKGKTEVPVITALKALVPKYPKTFTLVIGTSSLKKIIHDKFMVRDDKDAQYGSFNFTSAAGLEDNFFFIETDTPVANDLQNIADSIKSFIVTNEPQGVINNVQS